MPRFSPNTSSVSASIPVLDKDTYTFKIGEPKPAERTKKDAKVYGIQYPLTVVSGAETGEANKGKTQFFFGEWCDEQGNPSQFSGVTKQFMMAAYGYKVRDSEAEKEFDAAMEDKEKDFDSDSKYIGPFWSDVKGSTIVADASIVFGTGDKSNVQYQRLDNWRMVEAEG